MNWLDIVIIVAIAIPTVIGLRVGIIKAAFSLAGLILGVFLAGHYYAHFSRHLSFIPNENVAEIVAFILILVSVIVIAAVLARLLKWVTAVVMLSWVNRIGGAVLGLALGALFCCALLAACIKFFGNIPAISESHLATILLNYFSIVLALLPGPIRSFFIAPNNELII